MPDRSKGTLTLKGALTLAIAVAVYLGAQLAGIDLVGAGETDRVGDVTEAAVAPEARDDTKKIRQLFSAMRSDVQVQAVGEVVHLLPDDDEGSRHQLFLCELSNGLTLKISHNIDIAPYIPLETGDVVRFHGEYEWNEKGGVVHWTHRNTGGGDHDGGWIEHEGTRYQ
ncbi:MAG: DUF3465 domain-containing protein [Planctomycetota bacterium]